MSSIQNLRFASRLLKRSPGLVAVAALSLGLGIGVNTAIFSLVHAALFQTPKVESPGELVNIYSRREGSNDYSTSSVADWADLRERSGTIGGLAGHSWAMINVELGGQPTLQIGSLVTDGYFEMLGVDAAIGRRFLPEEQVKGASPVVLLTHRFWQRALSGREEVVGETLLIGGTDFEVVGILPRGFNGLLRALEAELFVPAVQIELVEPAGQIESQGRRGAGQDRYDWRGFRFLTLTGRLQEGATLDGAQAELQTLMANLAAEHPDSNERVTAVLVPASDVLVNPSVDGTLLPGAALVLVMVGLVLLVASANLANILLARAVARRREIGIRLALGAAKRQLVSQLLTESALLAAVGAVTGLAIAAVALRLIAANRIDLPISPSYDLRLDLPVLLFALALTVLTGLICGLVPALQSFRTNLIPALKAESGTGTERVGGRWRPSLGTLLVVGQVALSLILVIGASLLTRSVGAARQVDLGFDAEPIGVVTLDLDTLGLEQDAARERLNGLVERVRGVPGVEAAGVTTRMPLGLNMVNSSFFIEGFRETEDDPPLNLEVTTVDAGYFEAMDSELLEGRLFDSRDHAEAPPTAVVTRAMAQRFWPDQSALGQRFRVGVPDSAEYEIVGVIEDHKVITPGEETRPFVHFSWQQAGGEYGLIAFRTRGAANVMLESVYREIQLAEPGAFIMDTTTVDRMRDTMLLPVRAGGALLSGMGALALFLSGTGLAGLVAYRVGQRTREIGLRMALGAAQRTIVRRVLSQSLSFVAIGSLIGIAGAFALGQALRSVLYVSAFDPLSIIGGVAILTMVAALASIVPARRAASVDPLVALRQT